MENKKLTISHKFNEYKYRQSFSARICDDLCEVLLSYLSLEDKIQFECVSKQWKRCIYNKQNVFQINTDNKVEINHKLNPNAAKMIIDSKVFESLLKKCQFINNISIKTQYFRDLRVKDREELLLLIIKYCNRLKTISFDFKGITDNILTQFGVKFGQNLREINFERNVSIEKYKLLLRLCPILERVNQLEMDVLIDSNEVFVPKLRELHLNDNNCKNSEISEKMIETLRNKYENNVQYLSFRFLSIDSDFETIKLFSCFVKLSHLSVICSECDLFFDSGLKEIAFKCNQIKRLDFNIRYNYSPEYNVLTTIHYFSQIETLDLNLNAYKHIDARDYERFEVKYLNGCKLLTNLKISHPKIDDHSFKDIHIYLPQVTNLYVIYFNDESITDKTFKYLSKLNKLKLISFKRYYRLWRKVIQVTDLGLRQVINNCQQIQSILLKEETKITRKTIDALISVALRKPRIQFTHFFSYNMYISPVVNMNDKCLPNNLNLIISKDEETDELFEKY